MRWAVAERRRADFDIPAPLPRVCSHIRGADAGGSAISWGQWWFGACGFEAGAVNWVLDPFLAERFLLPLRLRSTTAYVWTHVMICVEANFPPASARACVNVPLTCRDRINLVQHRKYHGCWCPASLCPGHQHPWYWLCRIGTSSCLAWGRISTTCVLSMWRNDMKCKYMFLFLLKKIST